MVGTMFRTTKIYYIRTIGVRTAMWYSARICPQGCRQSITCIQTGKHWLTACGRLWDAAQKTIQHLGRGIQNTNWNLVKTFLEFMETAVQEKTGTNLKRTHVRNIQIKTISELWANPESKKIKFLPPKIAFLLERKKIKKKKLFL